MQLERLEYAIEEIKKAYQENEIEFHSLERKISSIRKAYIDNWEEEHLPYVRRFLDAVDKGVPTPALSVCGHGTQEIRFTKYLAYFLNPNKRHGLGSRLLEYLFADQASEAGLDSDWHKNCEVEAEKFIGIVEGKRAVSCICDIVVKGKGFVIFIEHKILSSESNNQGTGLGQLKRYSIAINNSQEFSNLKHIKVFLTPIARMPDGIKDWAPMSHEDVITAGIKLLKNKVLSSVARHNLLNFLVDLAMGPCQESEYILEDLTRTADIIVNKGFSVRHALKFDRLLEENQHIVNLLLEG